MLEHHRRIHEEPPIDDTVREARDSGGIKDQIASSRREDRNSSSGACSESNDSALEIEDRLNSSQHGFSEGTLQALRAELDGLKARREQALRTFDEDIEAISAYLRVKERRVQNATGNE